MKKPKKAAKTVPSLSKVLFDGKIVSVAAVFAFSLGLYFLSDYINRLPNIRPNLRAAGPGCKCDDPNACYPDGCSRDPGKIGGDCGAYADLGPEPGVVDQTLCVRPPDCCGGGGGNCCWIERGFCTPEQCGGSTKGGCGWYWIWHEEMKSGTWGCMVGDSPESMRPRFGSAPTVPPVPASLPPTSIPTRPVVPTNPPVIPSPTDRVLPSATLPAGNSPYPTYSYPTGPFYTIAPSYQLQPTTAPWIRPTVTQYLPPGYSQPTIYNPSATPGAGPGYPTSVRTTINNLQPTTYGRPPRPTEVFVLITGAPGQEVWVKPTGTSSLKLLPLKNLFSGIGNLMEKTGKSILEFLRIALP